MDLLESYYSDEESISRIANHLIVQEKYRLAKEITCFISQVAIAEH